LLERASSSAQSAAAGNPALPVVDSTGNAYVAWWSSPGLVDS